jgi:uncharacterized protein (TIGR02058 family)
LIDSLIFHKKSIIFLWFWSYTVGLLNTAVLPYTPRATVTWRCSSTYLKNLNYGATKQAQQHNLKSKSSLLHNKTTISKDGQNFQLLMGTHLKILNTQFSSIAYIINCIMLYNILIHSKKGISIIMNRTLSTQLFLSTKRVSSINTRPNYNNYKTRKFSSKIHYLKGSSTHHSSKKHDKTPHNHNQPSSFATNQSWSEEWKCLGLGARLPHSTDAQLTNLLFVQTGFGVDQHGNRKADGATKAAVRAVRIAIEFNSIPGIIEAVPGGRSEMLIEVLLGVPPQKDCNGNVLVGQPMDVDLANVAKVFPYGRLLPIQVVVGGLSFPTGRIVTELGDEDDNAICVVASVSIGYDSGERHQKHGKDRHQQVHKTYNTKDGF